MRYRTEGVHKVFGRSGGGKARFRQRTGSTGLFEDKFGVGCVMMKGVCCVTVAK